jgi:hypothetical protein
MARAITDESKRVATGAAAPVDVLVGEDDVLAAVWVPVRVDDDDVDEDLTEDDDDDAPPVDALSTQLTKPLLLDAPVWVMAPTYTQLPWKLGLSTTRSAPGDPVG